MYYFFILCELILIHFVSGPSQVIYLLFVLTCCVLKQQTTFSIGVLRKACRSQAGVSDLQAFQVFSQHPKLIYYAGKPIEN